MTVNHWSVRFFYRKRSHPLIGGRERGKKKKNRDRKRKVKGGGALIDDRLKMMTMIIVFKYVAQLSGQLLFGQFIKLSLSLPLYIILPFTDRRMKEEKKNDFESGRVSSLADEKQLVCYSLFFSYCFAFIFPIVFFFFLFQTLLWNSRRVCV